jgi:hypothetical protein
MIVVDLQHIIEDPALGFAVPQDVPPQVMAAYQRLTARGYDSRLLKDRSARCQGEFARFTSRTSSPACRPWPSCTPPTCGPGHPHRCQDGAIRTARGPDHIGRRAHTAGIRESTA